MVANEPLLTQDRLLRILGLSVVVAAGTITVLVLAPIMFPGSSTDLLCETTLRFTTFVFFPIFNLLNMRSETGTVSSLQTFTNRSIWVALLTVVVLQVLVVNLGLLQTFLNTTTLSSAQWGVALLVGSTVLWVEEIHQVIMRSRHPRSAAPPDHVTVPSSTAAKEPRHALSGGKLRR